MKTSNLGLLLFAGTAALLAAWYLRRASFDGPMFVGLGLGAALGAINIVLGYVATARAVKQGVSAALRTMLGGFFLRLVSLVGLILYFHFEPWVNVTSFAISFLAFFCVFLVIEVRLVQKSFGRNGRHG